MSERSRIPTVEEIASLPRRARVAFAARCARRVHPLFKVGWPEAPEKHTATVCTVITMAEHFGANGASATSASSSLGNHAARRVVDAAQNVDAAYAAYAAADCVAAVAFALVADGSAIAAKSCSAACCSAANRADFAAEHFLRARKYAVEAARRAIRRDFELVNVAAEQENWTHGTPVPPAFFGPLWPEGPPEGWPAEEDTSEGHELVLELNAPEGVCDEEVYARAIELAGDLDSLHRTHGGRGLKVKTVEVFEEAGVREGVPS